MYSIIYNQSLIFADNVEHWRSSRKVRTVISFVKVNKRDTRVFVNRF